jgi:hypothetical protein
MKAVIAPQAADDPAVIELAELSGNSPSQYLAEQAYRYRLKVSPLQSWRVDRDPPSSSLARF